MLIDVIHADPVWAEWSAAQLERLSDLHELVINPIIYAEVSAYYQSRREADMALSESDYRRLPLPYEAAFEAGQAFREYHRRGGARSMPLPDFFIKRSQGNPAVFSCGGGIETVVSFSRQREGKVSYHPQPWFSMYCLTVSIEALPMEQQK